jgi:competence protein ComEC
VTGWLAPVLAGAFWAGILLWPATRPFASIWDLLLAGLLGLGFAAWLAPSRASDVPLLRAGLLESPPEPAVRAIAGDRTTPARGPPGAVVASLVAATVMFGAGWAGFHELKVRSGLLARLAPRELSVEGTLATDPQAGGRGWSAEFHAGTVELFDPTTGRTSRQGTSEAVWLEGFGDPPRATRGDRLRIDGSAEVPRAGPFATSLERSGIVVILSAREATRLGPSSSPLVRATNAVRSVLLRHLLYLFPERRAGLLMGLALGDTSRLDPGDEEHFRATGLGHLVAVSGENVAMVLAPMLGLAVLLGLSARGRFLLGLGTVVFFVVLTGAEPSVMRAGVMAGFALVGGLLGRPRSTATLLGAAILVLLVVNPGLVWSIGFQLSVTATAGMVALAGPLSERLSWLPKPVAMAAGTTLSAQLGVSPLLLAYFHQVPFVTILANLLAFPAVSPALLFGLAAAAVATVLQPVAHLFAWISGSCIGYLEGLADRLASAPLPSITSGGGVVPVVVGFAVFGALVWWFRGRRGGPRRSRPAMVATAVVLPLFVWSTALSAGPPPGMRVRFFDVGQGDAALVTGPDGGTVLIDGGPDPELVATDLAALGVQHLDMVVATHPHLDHFTGLPAVLSRVRTDLVLDTGCDPPDVHSIPYRAFLTALQQEHVPAQHPVRGDVFRVGRLRMDVLSPDRCWQDTNSDANNDSIVLLVSDGDGDRVLFSNEPEASAQQVLLDDHLPITAQVMNVPHHGAGTSIAPFLQAVHDTVAVVSVGPNTYGHPVPWVIDTLRQSGARVLRTDRSGDVEITFAGGVMTVHTGHGRAFEFT